ncbi:MAG: hypothetical protein MN733_25550, partial [Nitrososphaera sp.]|nr:hypothetical protein [Nitrososphaera sp.]
MSAPDEYKLGVAERPREADVRGYHVMGSRERVTVELENRQKESLLSSSSILSGQAMASLGSYFTPRAELWLGQALPTYDYLVSVGYHRTKGYVDHSDRSGGHLGVSGGMLFESGAFEGYRLGGNVSYGSEGYRFYGSPSPATRREITNYRLGLSLSQEQLTEFSLTPNLDYSYFQVDDSAAKTLQQKATLGLNAELPLSSVTLVGNVSYTNATLSGAHSGHLTLFQLRVGTSRYWWNNLFLQGAASAYSVKGMSNQRFSRIYPDVAIGYRVGGAHLASVSYSGRVGFHELEGSVQANPYLSAGSAFWHSDVNRRLTAAIESDWSGSVKTLLSASNERVDLYAMPFDPLNAGIWQFAYTGATFWKYQAEGFAKLTPNDYVSGKVAVNSTKNDA